MSKLWGRIKGNEPRCSFCGKQRDQVRKCIAGPGVYICDDCVELCMEILSGVSRGDSGTRTFNVVSRLPDGSLQRSAHGPLPEAGMGDQCNTRWLRQCPDCRVWNVGSGITACLECGGELIRIGRGTGDPDGERKY